MTLNRRLVPTLLAFLMMTVLAYPVLADQSRMRDQAAARIRETKRMLIMKKAQQRVWKARLAKNPKTRLPKGFKLHPSRDWKAELAGGLAKPTQRAMAAEAEPPAAGRPIAQGAIAINHRVNDPTTDVFTDAGQGEPSAAALGNNVLMAWNDGDGFDRVAPNNQLIGWGYSSNGGTTWVDGGQLPQRPGSPNWVWSSDPVVVVNETNGEFLLAGLVFPDGIPTSQGGPGTQNGIAFVKGTFTAGVFNWGAPVLVVSGSNSTVFYDKEWIAVDPVTSNIFISFTKFTAIADEIDFTRSTSGGSTWSAPIKLSAAADDGFVQGSRVGVGPNSEIYVTWQAIGPIDKDYFKIRKSTNGGTSFSGEVSAADYYANWGSGAPGFNRERGITYPGLAVDRTQGPDRGRVYLSWNESVNYYPQVLAIPIPQTGNFFESENANQTGQNNRFLNAQQFTIGQTVRGAISEMTVDADVFKFNALQGQTVILFADTISSGLDLAFGMFCSDTTIRLALSSPYVGFGGIIVFTVPANGTYYMRCGAWTDTSTPGVSHFYTIKTMFYTPQLTSRARDHRDVFVSSSSNGLTWNAVGVGAPSRVNDDQPWFDNWLPEIAVTGHSRVFCTWFDWRDSSPTRCGGESSIYFSRSDDTGATWTNLGSVADQLTTWSYVFSNVAPNQGDYIALFANQQSIFPVWADGRDGNPNVYTAPILTATPALASLASSRVQRDRVELDWLAEEHAGAMARLERSAGAGWTTIAERSVDGGGRVTFVDTEVVPGASYGYRLAFDDGRGGTIWSREAHVTVPSGLTLALGTPQPNPAVRDLWLSVTLPSADPATLQLVDVAGRVVRSRDVGALGAGVHRLNLGEGEALPAGVYVVLLRQGDRTITTRASIVR